MPRRTRTRTPKSIETIKHEDAKRRNLPSAEHQRLMRDDERHPIGVAYKRRNPDLDPQLVWRGKDVQNSSELVVNAPPIYIQERVHPKVLIDDLMKQSAARQENESESVQGNFADLFDDFNGLPSETANTEFYQHDANWSNRMILGDSLQVMASLAEREGLRGKVQCIYIDPPYGISFNSNFQWSTTKKPTRDDSVANVTREPEQVKAYRDTWRDGVHSYLSYLRNRLTVAREMLTDSGSVFVQIGDENVHRIRTVMDETFGEDNFVAQISFAKTGGYATNFLTGVCDYILWYAKERSMVKFRRPFIEKKIGGIGASKYNKLLEVDGAVRTLTSEERNNPSLIPKGARVWRNDNLTSQGNPNFAFTHKGRTFDGTYKTTAVGMSRLAKSSRIDVARGSFGYVRFIDDFNVFPATAAWMDIGGVQSRSDPKVYVVQTATEAVKRCVLMSSDPGDLVLDPTCGAGTTAFVAEQWGRRWITIDTSRVALALARARIMGARFPFYLLADSHEGQCLTAEIERRTPSESPTFGDIRQGFVYERVPHITLGAIARNTEIDVIWAEFQEKLEPLRNRLNRALKTSWEEWEIPREVDKSWQASVKQNHKEWWALRIKRQREIDASIAAKAEYENLYDKPYVGDNRVRVAGPFTVESISPHRMLEVDENDELMDRIAEASNGYGQGYDFGQIILENLRTAGVQQAQKEDRIEFESLAVWPGHFVCAEGLYTQKGKGRHKDRRMRAGIFIGPEFGTVSRQDLVDAAREAKDADFDVLVACAFNYDAHTTELESYSGVPVLKARMNADLHMADDLKNTGKGNLFVIFGEPDIVVLPADDNQIRVRVNGVDVYHPNTGEVRSDGPEGIACWFIDTDYNKEAFFVRHAYFLGASDPYKSMRTTLKAEIDTDAWESLHSAVSRPFDRPESGLIAMKVINHLGDEVMKVFKV